MSKNQSTLSDTDLIETAIESKDVYTGGFLHVRRDTIRTAAGQLSQREYILHPGAAMIIPRLKADTFLILRQYRHAVGQVFWEFPAGKRDAGEDSANSASRELIEETGYEAKSIRKLTRIHPVIGYSNEFIDLYLAEHLHFVGQNLDKDEALHVQEIDFKSLLDMVQNGHITDVKTQIGVFWLEKILQNGW